MLDTYSGATRVIFIVGDPIAQVKAPAFATRTLRERGADAIVVPAHVRPQDLAAFMEVASRMPNVEGVIATVPHKFAMAGLCQAVAPRAASIGAVNVVRRGAEGRWFGDMCDGEGYVAGLRKAGCEPEGRRVLLVGAGGAGSAIAHALADAGVQSLALHDVDASRRDALLAKLRAYGAPNPCIGSADPSGFDLVVNATPMGMAASDPLPVDVDALDPGTFVGDVVTMPAVPLLIEIARSRGLATMTGMGMFEAVRDCLVDFYLEAR
ncbi:Shikimate dehydrogenase [Variovorax sp. PBL-H6]|uniref:shikimate dehydrogenase family protein n=1 Tax=Variovorax sp. PBL-H6 TaxID=434009 RepID=UPI0013199DCA|nr:ThiF family adenylyltransferase [Variovorax sp. PBL-H6]VTU31856.1 Shikimate dehydrogenase [Variovorax sp. PBL-H6]